MVNSNQPMTKTLDNSSQFVEPDSRNADPDYIWHADRFSRVGEPDRGWTPRGESVCKSKNFILLQINVYDRNCKTYWLNSKARQQNGRNYRFQSTHRNLLPLDLLRSEYSRF